MMKDERESLMGAVGQSFRDLSRLLIAGNQPQVFLTLGSTKLQLLVNCFGGKFMAWTASSCPGLGRR